MALLSLIYVAAAAELPLLGRTDAVDMVKGLKVVGDTAFTAAGASGLVAVNVKNPGEAKELWRVETGGKANSVDAVGDTVYVADGKTGLKVVRNGSVVGEFPEPCLEVQVSGGVAYLRSTGGDIVAIDVSNPTAAPELLGSYNESSAEVLFVVGTTVYITVYNSSNASRDLNIIDFGTPSSPVLIGSVEVASILNAPVNLFVTDTAAYVATLFSGLLIFDVTDPSSPSFTAVYDNRFLRDVFVSNNTAYLTDTSNTVIVDVSTDTPLFLGTIDTTGARVEVVGTTAYIAGGGIKMLDVSTPSSPVLLGAFNPPGGAAMDVAVSGNYAYLVGSRTTMQVMDISDPSSPKPVHVLQGVGARAVQVVGSTLYMIYVKGLVVYDATTPYLRGLGFFAARNVLSLHVVGTTAYIGTLSDGLQLLDVSKPSAITVVGTYPSLKGITSVFVSRMTVYATSTPKGLQLIDVKTPSSPTLIGGLLSFRSAAAVTVRGTTAYVADLPGLYVVDVSTLSAPTVVGLFKGSASAKDVKVVGDTAVVSSGSGLQLVDVSNPSTPTLIDEHSSTSPYKGIAVVGNRAYVAEVGMSVIEVWNGTLAPPTEAPPTMVPATPAPSTPAPLTPAPSTPAPATPAPATLAPTTSAPATLAPATRAPSTSAPSTQAPTTAAPGTRTPSTAAPSTTAPTLATPAPGNGGGSSVSKVAIALIVVGVAVVLIAAAGAGVWWWKGHQSVSFGGNDIDMRTSNKPLPSDAQMEV